MKSFRSRSGPFDQQLHFTTSEIDKLCFDALSKEKLLPAEPEPIRIDRFIEKGFKCQISYEDMGPGILGCTAFNGDGSIKLVMISNRLDNGNSVSERRMRATIAHEGGHALMHPILFMASLEQGRLNIGSEVRENLDFKERRILCRDSDVSEAVGAKKPYDGRWWEWQANRAIGGLLLPRKLMERALESFLIRSSITGTPALKPGIQDAAVKHLSDIFEVNPPVARIRLQEIFPETGGQLSF